MTTPTTISPQNKKAIQTIESKLLQTLKKILPEPKLTLTSTPLANSKPHIHKLICETIENVFSVSSSKLNIKDIDSITTIAEQIWNKQQDKKNMVIPLNKSKGKPPIFFICGITLYSPLAKKLADQFSCFGIYVEQEELFFKNANNPNSITIQHLASLYVEAITAYQIPGPYTIAGVSFGGVLAFEIARQLEVTETQHPNLIILDAVLPGALHKTLLRSTIIAARNIKKYLKERYILTFSSKSSKKSTRPDRKKQLWKIIQGKTTRNYFKNNPTFAGKTIIIRAEDQDKHQIEPCLCWSPKLEGEIILGEAPGAHLDILKSDITAELITKNMT